MHVKLLPVSLFVLAVSATAAHHAHHAHDPRTTTAPLATIQERQDAISPPSVQTDPMAYDMALTTIFTPPPECSGSFTQIGSNYWQNAIVPAPHTTLTSFCPSQFYLSAIGAANSVSLPPFNPLVCPSSWSALPYNSTYGVCCPDGWGAFAPVLSNIQRPLSGAVCSSLIVPKFFVDVTSYDDAGSMTVLPWHAGSEGGFLLATGFDGIVGDLTSTDAATSVSTPTPTSSPTGSDGISDVVASTGTTTSVPTSAGTTTSVPTSTSTSSPTAVSIGHAAKLRWFGL